MNGREKNSNEKIVFFQIFIPFLCGRRKFSAFRKKFFEKTDFPLAFYPGIV